jgi:hypothetical protein
MWKTEVATPPTLASMTKQQKQESRKSQQPEWTQYTHGGEKKPAENHPLWESEGSEESLEGWGKARRAERSVG